MGSLLEGRDYIVRVICMSLEGQGMTGGRVMLTSCSGFADCFKGVLFSLGWSGGREGADGGGWRVGAKALTACREEGER